MKNNKVRTLRPTALAAVVVALASTVTLTGCPIDIDIDSLLGKSSSQGAAQMGAEVAVPVTVITLKEHPVQLSQEISGRTSAYRVAEVRPQVNGILQKRLFTEGDTVKEGQPLYQIDPETYKANLDAAKASVAEAEANYSLAKADAARSAALVKVNAVSRQSNDSAQAKVKTTAAAVNTAKANLTTARVNLKYTSVNAPISGRVSISEVTPGALLTAYQSQRMTVIHQLDPIYVAVQQTNSQLLKLRRDLASGRLKALPDGSALVKVVLEDGTEYPATGKLAFQGVSVDENSGTVTLRAVFDNPDGILMPGMYVRAVLPSGDIPHAVTVSQHAVMRNQQGHPYVYVVNSENRVELREIGATDTVGAEWLVDSGLKAGERVVYEGLVKVRPGTLVSPTEAAN